MKQFKLKRDKLHFCSEKCRTKAISENRVDRKFEQASKKKRTGKSFACRICGEKKYQRISYYNRNVNKTCGKSECVSAYARSRWGLAPCPANHRRRAGVRRKLPKPKRASNFTAKQKADWLGCKCARCGATENLALDHILAVCAGGLSTRDNAQTLCQPCNNWKSRHVDMPLARAKNKLRKAA
jgi:5-methylcytosine-specific restriction endonuclease McrA